MLPPQITATLEDKLQSLSEIDLQERIVEPLLRKDGFEWVRNVAGPGEKGKDIIATKVDLGTSVLYAVQIKKLRVTGRVADGRSFTAVMQQLQQAIKESVFDPGTNAFRRPQRLIFITPFTINRATFEAAMTSYADLLQAQILIIDGPKLADMAIRLIPEIVVSLDDQISYKVRFIEECDEIREASAFGVNAPTRYSQIHVEIDIDCFEDIRNIFLEVFASRQRFDDIMRATSTPLDRPYVIESSRKRLFELASVIGRHKNASFVDFRCQHFFEFLCGRVAELTLAISAAERSETSPIIAQMFGYVLTLQQLIEAVGSIDGLADSWCDWDESGDASIRELFNLHLNSTRPFPAAILSFTSVNMLVVGPPGAGKTTLLHHIASCIASKCESVVVTLFRAIDLKSFTVDDVVQQVTKRLGRSGKSITKTDAEKMLEKGVIRLFIDGLDEAGGRLFSIAEAVRAFSGKFPRVVIIASVRDSVAMPGWPDAVRVKLRDFDGVQIKAFIYNWFKSTPSSANHLLSWLDQNKEMAVVVRTPILAALLCSLIDTRSKLPTTEVELYRARLNLFLGAWEEAKSISPMPRAIRRQYEFFLMHLAFHAHSREERYFDRFEALRLAPRFMVPGYNKSAASMIDDCVNRSILFVQPDGRLGFGHLTFQEHLVAEYFYHLRPAGMLAKYILNDWWWKPLVFFAILMEDMTEIIDETKRSHKDIDMNKLRVLSSYAHRTSSQFDWAP